MKHINSLFACMAILVAVFSATPVLAASDQYKEEAVQQAHQPATAPAAVVAEPAPAAKAPATAFEAAKPVAAAPAAAQQRRRMETPVLVMLIGGVLLLLAIVFTIIAIVSASFGAGILVALFWTLGWLAVIAGLIWWLVTR